MAMSNTLSQVSISSSQVYDGGELNPISAEELKGNLVAIRQLINNYNEKARKLEVTEASLQDTRSELEFQNTYPFIAFVSAIFNVSGTIIVGISVNAISEAPMGDISTTSIVSLFVGALMVIIASTTTVLYSRVHRWLNHK